MRVITFILFFISIAVLTGCAAPLKKAELETVKKIAVVNNFPKYPNYAVIGTTVFSNEYDEIYDDQFLRKVVDVTVDYLSKKGYDVKKTDSSENSEYKEADLVLTLIPRDIYQIPGTNGYGVQQRYFLGAPLKPIVYVALNIRPELHGKAIGNAYYKDILIPLSFESLPNKWNMLTEAQRKEIIEKLNQGIEQTILELLRKVGV